MLKVFCSCGTFWLSKTICEFSLTVSSQAKGNFSCDSNIVATEQNGFHLAQQTRKLNQNFQFSKHFVLAPTSFSTLPWLHEEPVTFPLDPAVHYHRCFIGHYTVTALTNSFLLICMLTTGCRHGVLHPRSAASCRLLLIALIYFWHQPSQMMNESPSQQSEKGTCASLTSVRWKIRLTANGITLETIIVISGCFLYWINNIWNGTIPNGMQCSLMKRKWNKLFGPLLTCQTWPVLIQKRADTRRWQWNWRIKLNTISHHTHPSSSLCLRFVKSPQKTFYFGVYTWNSATLRSDQLCWDLLPRKQRASICFHSFLPNLLRLTGIKTHVTRKMKRS